MKCLYGKTENTDYKLGVVHKRRP